MRLRATLAAGSQTEALGTAGPSEAATGAGKGGAAESGWPRPRPGGAGRSGC